ncbi:DUF3313 domain-containing protein [Siccibacter colletis]|uniref:DUF3313 domain-containing protein n=1 Tax=Siccibacter colletis TaxID=1505757 RepID=A0ABY6J959_9ENTR|nr:DUF3313 domain-containing protein [Siccibacter colletis]UYU30197.1 DUF3313 domain-containing protein [Siccibacter colletis]
MRISPFVKTSLLTAALVLAGCSSNVTQSDKYSGFLKDYSDLQETTSASGKPVLRWVAPGFNEANYDSMVYNPIVFYPPPQPTAQVSQEMLDGVLNYTNTRMKEAAAKRKPLVTTPGPRSLIFRGAITGVDSSKKGFQVYEVLPIALVVAGTQVATGHRTMNTDLYFEGELIDAATQQPVMKVVRKGAGKTLRNENTPMTVDTLKSVIDDLAVDAEMFNSAPAK